MFIQKHQETIECVKNSLLFKKNAKFKVNNLRIFVNTNAKFSGLKTLLLNYAKLFLHEHYQIGRFSNLH